MLLAGAGEVRAGFHGAIISYHHAIHAVNSADACHQSPRGEVDAGVNLMSGEQTDFKKGGTRIKQ